MSDEPVKRRVVKATPTEESPQKETKYGSTPDNLFKATQNYDQAEEDFLAFVKNQIANMQSKLLFNTMPSMDQINDSLATYESTLFALLSLYATARIESATAGEEYDDAWSNCVVEMKKSLGLDKYVSGKELEHLARVNNMEQLSKLKAKQIAADHKLALMNQLVDAWKNFEFVLNQLSRNAGIEKDASKISSNERVGNYLADTALGN